MKERDIENLILSGFQKELIDRTPTYYYEMFMMTMRSLCPDLKKNANIINYERYSEELKLWRYYRRGSNEAINEIVLRGNKTELFDESSFIRTLPIFLANEDTEKAVAESFKNTIYFTYNIDNIFSSILFGIIVCNKLKGMELKDNLDKVKENVISFRTMEYLKETDKSSDNLYMIKIESKRIDIMQLIDRTISEIEGEFDGSESSAVMNFLEKVSGTDLTGEMESFLEISTEKDSNYLRNIGRYLYRLRKGRVSPESLIFKRKDDESIFSFREGETFTNSILGSSVLEKIEIKNGFELRYIKSKSGRYRFFRKIK